MTNLITVKNLCPLKNTYYSKKDTPPKTVSLIMSSEYYIIILPEVNIFPRNMDVPHSPLTVY